MTTMMIMIIVVVIGSFISCSSLLLHFILFSDINILDNLSLYINVYCILSEINQIIL